MYSFMKCCMYRNRFVNHYSIGVSEILPFDVNKHGGFSLVRWKSIWVNEV